ncbi:MAG: peptide-methionine (S)-S-oxide reductase [Flavobacteriales bacterium]|jgi:peptide-methionine (S)-S-oxide reductase
MKQKVVTLVWILFFITNLSQAMNQKTDTITLGAGCFWCIEAVFQHVKGVENAVSGYSNGKIPNPTYAEICTGLTGHAEVIQLTYDPSVVSLTNILEVFFGTHDPTTLNRQGADRGTQYRSAIFYHTIEQKEIAEKVIKTLNEQEVFNNPIVTEVTPVDVFYVAGNAHQDYYFENGDSPYCRIVIEPKLEKLKKVFSDKLK